MEKIIEKPSITERAEDFDDGNFGWVWMQPDGFICPVCRNRQPQSKRDCIEGHTLGEHDRAPGIPIPWTVSGE